MIEAIAFGNIEAAPQKSGNGRIYSFSGGQEPNGLAVYPVLPGISVMYQTFHSEACLTNFHYHGRVLTVDCCCEGRIEWQCSNDTYSYLEERNIQVSTRQDCVGSFGFPTRHYHGATIVLKPEEATRALLSSEGIADLLGIDPDSLWKRYDDLGGNIQLPGNPELERMFREISVLDPERSAARLRLKVLDILLQLGQLELTAEDRVHQYYPRSVVEKVRQAKELLFADPSARHSLQELSARFGLSETMLKRGFKSVYGNSPYAYLKEYRLQLGADALRAGYKSIAEIALDSGYENPSKFTAAFRAKYGMTPSAYRNSCRKLMTGTDY